MSAVESSASAMAGNHDCSPRRLDGATGGLLARHEWELHLRTSYFAERRKHSC
jgi:hypothetical protein